MTVVINNSNDVDIIKKWENHIDYAIDINSYPEIHHIENVRVTTEES